MRYERGIALKRKRKRIGITMIELLIVLGIIALLVGLLLPALSAVKKIARETKQKAQLSTIGLALTAFKNDYGDYPPSDGWDYTSNTSLNYCGAQKLAEALLGWDLMGFHPDSHWQADGKNIRPYRSQGVDYAPGAYFFYDQTIAYDIERRKGPYLELASADAFRTGGPEGLFFNSGALDPDRFVLCDVFGRKKIGVLNQVTGETTRYKAGTPILYFRADTSSRYLGAPESGSIYRAGDNRELMGLGSVEDMPQDVRQHPFYQPDHFSNFLQNIMDPKASTADRIWPRRRDSFILISAGVDGLYGTNDDITNFGK